MTKTKVKISVKGTARGVKKALSQITSEDIEEKVTPLRQADFVTKAKQDAKR